MTELINKFILADFPQSLIYLVLMICFTLLITVFNHQYFLKLTSEYKAYLFYFLSFFTFLFLIPVLSILIFVKKSFKYLQSIGFYFGDVSAGGILLLIILPVLFIVSWFSVKDPAIQKQYPFSKEACSSLKKFLNFEVFYLIFYYFAWEFVFRGFIFFTLVRTNGLVVAMSVTAIISTIYHIGHPKAEIFGALAAGIGFGIVAYITGSFFYSFVLHAFLGICNDCLLYYKCYRKKVNS
jgi:membrane protease YdiL (CAAX protease family)